MNKQTKKDPYYYITLLENYTPASYYEGRGDREKVMMGERLEEDLNTTFFRTGHNFDFKIGCRVEGVIHGQGKAINYTGTFLQAGSEGLWVKFDKAIYMPLQEEEEEEYLIEPANCKDTINLIKVKKTKK